MQISKKKFLRFGDQKQHKYSAQLLEKLYNDPSSKYLLETYNEVQSWMDSAPLTTQNIKIISDRYHTHLKLAELSTKEHKLLPATTSKDRSFGQPYYPINIYLDKIRSAHNIGSIIRTTEALRLGSLFFSSDTAFITNKKVKDTAMGSEPWVSCTQCDNAASLPKPLIALETSTEAESLYTYQFPESFTLALGNEEYGLSEETLSSADVILSIPMRGRKNSLNVANAYAIVASEIVRQRSNKVEVTYASA